MSPQSSSRFVSEDAAAASRYPFVLIAILLLGLGLRLVTWGENRFLEDEALYAYWGLQITTGADPMLSEEPVDKPPLYPYTLALSFLLTSPSKAGGNQDTRAQETAARLPSLLASVAGIALVYALGRDLFGDERVGLLAALLLALSPFDLLFASTAFTDPMMTTLVLGSLLAAARDRLGAAGLLTGLAATTKQQGLFFLPLVVAVGLLAHPKGTPDVGWDGIPPHEQSLVDEGRDTVPPYKRAIGWLGRLWGRRWLRFVLGFVLVAAAVLWWDAARVQRPGPSPVAPPPRYSPAPVHRP